MSDSHDVVPFAQLSPDAVLQAVESQGYITNGRILALNSYENRVYQVGIEEAEPVIVKFYRPQRWTTAQILEEHHFCAELLTNEVSVVTPLQLNNQSTLAQWQGIQLAIFPRRGGRAPELDDMDHLYAIGQHLGRLHAAGKIKPFQYRPALSVQTYGYDSMAFLLENCIPKNLRISYETLAKDLLIKIEQAFAAVDSLAWIRTHGDCHIGNMLWRDDRPHFVDFDDARMAPAIQDLWMLLSGDRFQQALQLSEVLEGYDMFNDFNRAEIALIEPLRTLRMMHYAAWLARRWEDPAFPLHFPWFNTERYWGEHILQLREQLFALGEPHLQLP
jgi:Ser/Thr protein kinase RdoA (MazF antagonist)